MSLPSCHDADTRSVRFVLLADSFPGLLPRVMAPFARRDLVPDQLSATRNGDVLRVEIAMAAMPPEYVHLIEGNLRQIVGVHSVMRTVAAPPAELSAAAA